MSLHSAMLTAYFYIFRTVTFQAGMNTEGEVEIGVD